MPIERVSRGEAIDRDKLHLLLSDWLQSTCESTIAPPDLFGPTPWLYVRDDGKLFRLHADTRREGVSAYLALVEGPSEVDWSIATNQRGKANAVVFGPDRRKIPYFYLYLVDEKQPTGSE